MRNTFTWMALGVILLASSAGAAVVSYGFTTEYSGGASPAGPSPWLMAELDDDDTPGTVTLTLSAQNLVGSEFVRSVFFNLDPVLDPTSMAVSVDGKIGTLKDPWVALGVDSYKAAGGGYFDFRLGFAASGYKGGLYRFGAGEEIVLSLSLAGLTVDSFDFLSKPSGGAGALPVASHIQSINGDDSGWVTGGVTVVPEPMTMGLLAVGGLVALLRRK
jgi:hypothetical protein